MSLARHRDCLITRGARAHTQQESLRAVAALDPAHVLWISDSPCPDASFHVVAPGQVSRLLGRSFDAVVLDAHALLDPDVLGQCYGFVRGGGALVLRLRALGAPPPAAALVRYAAYPYGPEAVADRFERRLERALARGARPLGAPLTPPPELPRGSAEQDQLAQALAALMCDARPARAVVLADRGRGKSSALGMALARARAELPELRAVIAGPSDDALAALKEAHAREGAGQGAPQQVTLAMLLADAPAARRPEVILIDEAAQLPVPLLQRLCALHPQARLIFASTVHGYEGTGRGFTLRFLSWLTRQPQGLTRYQLTEPIRWDSGDPLERLVFDALLLDAEPAPLPATLDPGRLVARRLDRDALAQDEPLLRSLFGLLVQAHYRTTPGDLRRLLDAPNLEVHALCFEGAVVSAALVAIEGALPGALCAQAASGQTRLRAHALPDALVAHMGLVEAGALRMVRSVRIATHPQARRIGAASRLIAHVHQSYAPDLFGTLFGASAEVIALRRALGYEIARVSASRGARTGEPAVMMLRAETAPGRAILAAARAQLARELDAQLELMQVDDAITLDPALIDALRANLPAAAPLDADQRVALVRAYAFGPRPFEANPDAVRGFVLAHRAKLSALSATHQALITGRALARQSWARVMADARTASMPATMRALRHAVRALIEAVDASGD